MKKILVAAMLTTGLYAEIFLDLENRCYHKGSTIDCYNLALMYRDGDGLKRNMYNAVKHFKMVCDKGEPEILYLNACYELGFIYYLGTDEGIRQDLGQAYKLFSIACDKGMSKSCYQLGIMYNNADGVDKNTTAAKEYFGKACKFGYDDGCKDLERLNNPEWLY